MDQFITHSMEIRDLKTKHEMMDTYSVLTEVYPSLTIADYSAELDFMLPMNYGQAAVYENGVCVGVCGYWVGSKLWCGKYLELDNVVISEKYRSKGVGKLLFEFMYHKGTELNVTMLALDSYTSNFKAHKFFYNEGFAPRGFHFIRILDKSKVR